MCNAGASIFQFCLNFEAQVAEPCVCLMCERVHTHGGSALRGNGSVGMLMGGSAHGRLRLRPRLRPRHRLHALWQRVLLK